MSSADTRIATLPQLERLVTGPGIQHPSVRDPLTHRFADALPAGTRAEDFGYVEEEYFVSGATTAGEPYRTRVVVRRPRDISEFSGMVMAEVMHPSSSALIWQASRIGMMKNGHVAIEIADHPGRIETLKEFNSARYSDLHVPDGIAIFDGFYLTAIGSEIPTYDIPTIHLATETETVAGTDAGNRPAFWRENSDAPDSPFRMYEVAGMPHLETRESPAMDPATCADSPLSSFMYNALTYMGLAHVFNWAAYGVVPPSGDRIAISDSGIARDRHGNALGGVRSPQMDVPTFHSAVPNSGESFLCGLSGSDRPFDRDSLMTLYDSRDGYAQALRRRSYELMRQGWFPQEYWHEIEAEIERVAF
jgi:hypothetical protein